jgi:hypothetical protein
MARSMLKTGADASDSAEATGSDPVSKSEGPSGKTIESAIVANTTTDADETVATDVMAAAVVVPQDPHAARSVPPNLRSDFQMPAGHQSDIQGSRVSSCGSFEYYIFNMT